MSDSRSSCSPARFEHAGLRTRQLQAMREWYVTVLDGEVTFEDERIAFVAFDERNHRLALIARPGLEPRPVNSDGLDHLAFGYETAGDLLKAYRRLKARGIEPQRTTDHGSSISLYYADPDGNQIELKVDSLADNASQRAFLKSAEFKASPTGHPIDMDVFAASLEQTESR